MADEADIEDIKFEKLLEDRRFRELKAVLKVIADKDNKDVINAIQDSKELVEKFAEAIKKLPAPEVTVELSNLEKAASQISIQQKEVILLLKEVISQQNIKKEWEFTIVRSNPSDLIKTVIAKQIK